ILVPLDGSAFAEAALAPAASLLKALAAPERGELHLSLVISPDDTTSHHLLEPPTRVDNARAYLMRVADHLRGAYPQLAVSWSLTPEHAVARTLLRVAEGGASDAQSDAVAAAGAPCHYDLIAMATHGRTGFTGWALGSNTERVLHGTTLPLLMVRPQGLAGP